MKNVLVIGSGGREHALVWKLSQSKNIGEIFVAPGNGGTGQVATNVPIAVDNIAELITFAKTNYVDPTIVGPDSALAAGIIDQFRGAGLRIFGPTKKAAEIEWSKSYAKQIMKKYDIPTASYEVFSKLSDAKRYISQAVFPLVIKVDGLALGKGVIICQTIAEANDALRKVLDDKQFGRAGKKIVIEEYLEGTEVSAHAICDGENFILFPLAQDHKRIGEGNTGPMTGGMGTICPVPEPIDEIGEIIGKTLSAMKKEGREFTGCLFPGIMLTKNGPKVLEFNARFGDPETQVYMRLLENDLLEIFDAAVEKRLDKLKLQWKDRAAACVVLASKGYPADYQTGFEITGINGIDDENVTIFHAGTKKDGNKIITNGGRVLNLTAVGKDLTEARERCYQASNKIDFVGKTFRKDIGYQYINRF